MDKVFDLYNIEFIGDNNQKIILTTLRSKSELDQHKLTEAAVHLAPKRQELWLSLSGHDIHFEKMDIERRAGGVDVTFLAHDKTESLQASVTVAARPSRAVTLCYYKYYLLLNKKEFTTKSIKIRSGLQVD